MATAVITSASIASTDPQADGRTYVTEVQVDDTVGPLVFTYLADPGTDFTAVMNARTAQLNQPPDTYEVVNEDGSTTDISA